jgi:hypothetical protein
MPIKICKRCQMRVIIATSDSDFIHECNSGNLVLDQEDLPLVETTWSDYTGTATPKIGDVRNTSRLNKLDGSRAAVEGSRLNNFTIRGNNADTTRTRQHLQYMTFEEENKNGKSN